MSKSGDNLLSIAIQEIITVSILGTSIFYQSWLGIIIGGILTAGITLIHLKSILAMIGWT